MARRKSKMTVGARYVGIGALTELLIAIYDGQDPNGNFHVTQAAAVAEALVDAAWDVEHFPVAGKVQITLDLGRLDQPADQPGPDAASNTL